MLLLLQVYSWYLNLVIHSKPIISWKFCRFIRSNTQAFFSVFSSNFNVTMSQIELPTGSYSSCINSIVDTLTATWYCKSFFKHNVQMRNIIRHSKTQQIHTMCIYYFHLL